MEPQTGGNYWQGDQNQPELNNISPPPKPQQTLTSDSSEEYITRWQASEYVDHQRDASWFAGLVAIAALLIIVDVFFIRGYIFSILIIVMAITLIIYSRRPSRIIDYALNEEGILIGQRFRAFDEFRGFGVIQDGGLFCVRLLPVARFGQEVTVYFPEDQGEVIVDTLGAYLPMEDIHFDAVDRLLRRLRL